MWTQTQVTKKLQIAYPIVQAPMAGEPATAELVAAVSNAGGLGSLGAAYMTPAKMSEVIDKIQTYTNKPFAVNLFVPQPYEISATKIDQCNQALQKYREELGINKLLPQIKPPISFAEQMEVIFAKQVPIFSFTFGIPDKKWLKILQQKNIVTIGTATTVTEAKALADANIDIIVAQGSEAGGHRGTFINDVELSLIGSMALIPQIVDAVTVPIIAAGGIMDGRGIAAALCLGAQAVQMGTAFLTCREAGISECYQQKILQEAVDETALTRAFSGKYARGINNRFIQEMAKQPAIADFYIQGQLTTDIKNAAQAQHNTELMQMWAGQAAGLGKLGTAASLVAKLVAETTAKLQQLWQQN